MPSYSLTLVRGLPGSGKTRFATTRLTGRVVSADNFFYDEGRYCFAPAKLSAAHAWCLDQAAEALSFGHVIVANTFSQRWEMQPYILLAEERRCPLLVVDLFDGGQPDAVLASRNEHEVPVEAIARMRERWEHCWRTGSLNRPLRQ